MAYISAFLASPHKPEISTRFIKIPVNYVTPRMGKVVRPDYQKSRTDAQMKESMTNGTKNPNYVKLSDLGVDLAELDNLIKLVRGFSQ